MNLIGTWQIGKRMSGKFTASQYFEREDGSLGLRYIQDERTCDDALFETRNDAVRAAKAFSKKSASTGKSLSVPVR